MRVPFRLVDVFTERPLAGNQLCVVPEPIGVSDELMQALAQEIGFAETTFVNESGGDRYAMRIFTPGGELPFAGHPTLGTAFVMVSEGRVSTPVTQVVTAGEIRVEVDVDAHSARMRQLAPKFGPEVEDLVELARALGLAAGDLALTEGLTPQIVSTGLHQLIVPARDPAAVERAWPDLRTLLEVLVGAGADGCYLFALRPDGTALARFFAPGVGVAEDAATGSAAGPLGAYLAERGALSSGRLTIHQGESIGRPSMLVVDVERENESWAVHVGGGVFVVGEGQFEFEPGAALSR